MDNPGMNATPWVESEEKKAQRAKFFAAAGLPTLVYAMLYTACLYNNFGSITMPLFVIVTVVYVFMVQRRLQAVPKLDGSAEVKEWRIRPLTIFCVAGMMLLAVSTACTGSTILLCINNVGICLLLVTALVSQRCDTEHWTLSRAFLAVNQAVFGAVGELCEPFSDLSCYRRGGERRKSTRAFYVLAGIGLAVPLLAVILALLYRADAVFAHVMDSVFRPDIRIGSVVGVTLMGCWAFWSAYCGLRYLQRDRIASAGRDWQRWEPLVANTVLTLVAAVYLTFSLIQILYLFWGGMELPAGYTYAEYAREGFFQLLFVCVLNVLIVLFFMGCFGESRFKNTMLMVISLCTYIMLASSALRMCMYIRVFNLTFLRFFVLWMLAFLAILLAGVMVSICRRTFPIFHYTVVVTTVCVLCLTFAHPDYWIAGYNVAEAQDGDNIGIDEDYLIHLSSDAAPVLAGQKELAEKYAASLGTELDTDLRHYNFSKARARKLLTSIDRKP